MYFQRQHKAKLCAVSKNGEGKNVCENLKKNFKHFVNLVPGSVKDGMMPK